MAVDQRSNARVVEQTRLVLARCEEAFGSGAPESDLRDTSDFTLLETRLGAALTSLNALRAGGETGLADLVAECAAAHCELLIHQRERRDEALKGVQRALARLRALPTAAAVMDSGARELCRQCGFSRALLFRIHNVELVLESMHLEIGKDLEDTIRAVATEHVPKLDHVLRETDMFRRREALLVADPQNDRRAFAPLIAATQTDAYVAAPILPSDTVIGFIHADRFGQETVVDGTDRDALAAFAEGFGFALERAALRERLRRQRTEVDRLTNATKAMLEEAYASGVSLSREPADAEVAEYAAGVVMAPDSRLDFLLTRREVEVLGLMAEGATNATIANRLVISESTVKSHVKHVMRKLRVSNRAEAVSRYHRIRHASRPRNDA